MLRQLPISVLTICSLLSFASAGDYTITGVGQPALAAIASFEKRLEDQKSGVSLTSIPGLANPSEFIELLEHGVVDIAVVPFELVPALAQSPLLEPFLAQNAVEVHQAINSEVGAFEKSDVEKDGFRVLDFWHVSSTIFGSKNPVTDVGDLRGLKIYDGGLQRDETLAALGADPTQMAFADVIPSLQAGAIDSSAVPLDNRAQALGFVGFVTNYVDRLYKPRIHAVLVSEERWLSIPFPDQHYLAKTAVETSESLVRTLDAQAARFRSDELARGSVFYAWNTNDVEQVRVASLSAVGADSIVESQLVNLAFDNAAAVPPPPDTLSDPRSASEVTLLFATDREMADMSSPETAFSSSRILRGHTFGSATVALKNGRKFGNDLKKVSDIENLSTLTKDAFLARISNHPDREFVIFVHGYHNAFTDGIRRGATIQADITANATVISYTWPSDGELLSYGYDESSIDIAEQNFKLFMDALTGVVSADRMSIIAHSMGSRLLTKYLAGLPERGIRPDDIKFKNIVFAAPDISTTFFKQKEEAPFDPDYPLSVYANQITVYSSKYDRPLGLSQKLHRDQRLGLADKTNIYLEPDITAVDASLIDPAKWYQKFSFATRHSYVFDKSAGVRDLSLLLSGSNPAIRPGMTPDSRNGLSYWVLAP